MEGGPSLNSFGYHVSETGYESWLNGRSTGSGAVSSTSVGEALMENFVRQPLQSGLEYAGMNEDAAYWTSTGVTLAGSLVLGEVGGKGGKFIDAGKKELSNFLKENAGQTKDVIIKRLQKSIRKHQKVIDSHKQYLKDPTLKYGDKWKSMSPQHQKNALYHWEQDIQRASDYLNVKQDYLNKL